MGSCVLTDISYMHLNLSLMGLMLLYVYISDKAVLVEILYTRLVKHVYLTTCYCCYSYWIQVYCDDFITNSMNIVDQLIST